MIIKRLNTELLAADPRSKHSHKKTNKKQTSVVKNEQKNS